MRALLSLVLLASTGMWGCTDEDNNPPVFSGLETEVRTSVGETVSLFVTARDPEGKPVALTMEKGPSGSQFVVSGLGRFVWEPAQKDAEAGGKAHDVVFKAEDADGVSATFRVVILVFPSEGDIRFTTSNSRVLVLERSPSLSANVSVQADNKTEVNLTMEGAPAGMTLTSTGPKSARVEWTPTSEQIAKKLIWSATLKAEPGTSSEVSQNLSVTLVPKSCGDDVVAIEHAPLGEQRAAGDYTVTATIRAQSGAGVQATLFARVGGDPNDSGGFEGVAMANTGGDTYTASIPNPNAEVDAPLDVYYFIVAVPEGESASGCISRAPEVGLNNFPAFAAGDDSCRRDRFEPNEATGDAVPLAEGTEGFSILSDRWELYGLAICPGDKDVFSVDLEANTGVSVLVLYPDSGGPLTLRGLDPAGNEVSASTGQISGEASMLLAASEAGTHTIEISGEPTDYRVLFFPRSDVDPTCVDNNLEPNESADLAIILPSAGTYDNLRICADDKDYFGIAVPDGNTLTVDLLFSHADGDLDLKLQNKDGLTVGQSFSETDNEQVIYINDTGREQSITIEIRPALGATAEYVLDVTIETSTTVSCDPDFLEPNNTPEDARLAITEGLEDFNASMCGDDDIYAIDAKSGQTLTASISSSVPDADLDIAFLDPSETVRDTADSTGSDESLSFTATSDGTHYLRVYRASGTGVGDYTVNLAVEDVPLCQEDLNEVNDAKAFAYLLDQAPQLLTVGLCAGDVDVFAYSIQSLDYLAIDLTPLAIAAGDPSTEISARIESESGEVLSTGGWFTDKFLLDYEATSSQLIYIIIENTATTGEGYLYDLSWEVL